MPKPLTITLTREIADNEVNDSLDNIWRDQSPWVGGIHGPLKGKWKIRYDGADDEEGSFASVRTLTAKQFVAAFQKAADEQRAGKHHGLCCLETMETDELGLGCAQDHDAVLQYALLGELVYG